MRSEGFFTYSRGTYTNFLHEERKRRRLFFARRAYSTHFTHRMEKKYFSSFYVKTEAFYFLFRIKYTANKCLYLEKSIA